MLKIEIGFAISWNKKDVTQPHGFSDANQWVNAEPATSANFENVPSPSI